MLVGVYSRAGLHLFNPSEVSAVSSHDLTTTAVCTIVLKSGHKIFVKGTVVSVMQFIADVANNAASQLYTANALYTVRTSDLTAWPGLKGPK